MNKLLAEGLTDAVGFLAGAVVGYAAGRLAGLDMFSTGYDTASIAAIALVGIGGGLGVQLARRWRAARGRGK